ncbi:MAG TPA: RIP metalloprotease RseP [Candidatus Omnitrophota bacterium]|jgi:regulator of sigma E protease|nr:MAG: Metalloprotease MmpA [Candidatus Omnitrophica bacterium ADurb.Bin314]HOE68874.1 RIP metalloprotease RseP [Candidatus Omnitrophota bacterium]HPW65274.1 RIP metalloprotease RseP [Candidatus Omnitrophota bacterium]HQB94553.1 RIP metalloprotease RseP [Candidatus Omnitrophota bacterium]
MSHLLSVVWNILPALVVFGILIIVHEWGHFIACRMCGVKVEKFSIGFGPELFGWNSKETRFVVSLLPLGGFIKPSGEEASAVGAEGPKPGDFLAATAWSRIIIVTAGVTMNFALAFVLFSAVFMTGRPMPGTVIGGFIKGYPGESSGLAVKDRIVRVNGTVTGNWKDVLAALDSATGPVIEIAVVRTAGQELSVGVIPKVEATRDIFGKPVTLRRIGITPDPEIVVTEKYGVLESIAMGWETVVSQTVLTYKAIYYICARRLSPKNLMGPLGIVQVSGQAARAGIPALVQLMAILSVSLAAINLLPIPALDGGHLVFLLIEALFRRPIPVKVQEKVTNAGFYALMGLMVLVFYNDIVNLQVVDKIRNLLHLSGH